MKDHNGHEHEDWPFPDELFAKSRRVQHVRPGWWQRTWPVLVGASILPCLGVAVGLIAWWRQ